MNQAASQQQKIIVKLHEHEESIDLAKLQTSMLKLFYVGGVVDWDEGMAQSNKSFLTANTHSRSFDLAPTMKAHGPKSSTSSLAMSIPRHYPIYQSSTDQMYANPGSLVLRLRDDLPDVANK